MSDTKNLTSALKENQAILAVIPSQTYNNNILDVIKTLRNKKVCYVTLNKTYESLEELFKKNKVNLDNIIFIDAISKSLKKTPDQSERCYYISSPGALTELSIAITKFLNHGFDYLIFDSISNILIYQKKEPAIKFISNLINKIKVNNTKAIFYALDIKDQESYIKESSMFVDETIDIKQ